MSAAAARITVLMTQDEKERLMKRAADSGMSTGEFIRRAASAYSPDDDNAILEGLLDQMLVATDRAEQAIDDTLAFVLASNQRMDDQNQRQGDS